MASNGVNGTNGPVTATTAAKGPSSRFDPTFTQRVIDTMGPNMTPRNRQVMSALVRHLHDFAREVELTPDEWMAGVHFINSVGQISTKTRNEAHRVSDVLGLERCVFCLCDMLQPFSSSHPNFKPLSLITLLLLSLESSPSNSRLSLVDEIANKIVAEGDIDPTSSSILGPFWSPNAPFRDNGSSIIQDPNPDGRVALMHGTITDLVTGKPIPGAVFDIWQASANGKYDFQDPENQSPNNLRGKFRADDNGKYWFYCYHPTAYSLPTDGPAYQLLSLMDRHPMRPAHIHIMVSLLGDGASRWLGREGMIIFDADFRLSRSRTPITRAAPRSCIPGTTPGWPPTPSLPSRTTSLSTSSRARATTRPSWISSTMSSWRPRTTRASSFDEEEMAMHMVV
jgi:catechol 1,2-dioxygenase